MKTRSLAAPLLTLVLLSSPPLGAADASPKPGYKVVVEVSFNEEGKVEAERVVESEDFSGEQILNQLALNMASQIERPPVVHDGHKVKFKVRAPFDFPIEDDEGAAANLAPQPSVKSAAQPIYPPALGAQGVVGGAIVEVVVGPDGQVKNFRIMRASHPEFAEAVAAVMPLWTFHPAVKDGNPVEARWRIAIGFATDTQQPAMQWRIAPRPSLGGYLVVHSKIAARAMEQQAAPAPAPAPASAPPK